VKPEDRAAFANLVAVARQNFNDRAEAILRHHGGHKLGVKVVIFL